MICRYCKQEFPDEYGGPYCPRCEDLINETHDIMQEQEEN